jgi:hypothetical protein
MGKIRQPLTVSETVDLANSLIKGSEHQEKLIRWKQIRNPEQPLSTMGSVGYGWFQGFKRRHGDKLVTKRGERFAVDCADWSKHIYMKQMYDVIYNNMVEAGIAMSLVEPICTDKQGNEVEVSGTEIFGLPCDIEILHPEFILFADETGWNKICSRTKYSTKRNCVYIGQAFYCIRSDCSQW